MDEIGRHVLEMADESRALSGLSADKNGVTSACFSG
jgi:hypothetical protein